MLSIKQVSPFEPAVSDFITQLDEYQSQLYPASSNHLDSRETLSQDQCVLLAAYNDSKLCGIGAVKICQDYGEVKRMFVPDLSRGMGVGDCVLAALEKVLGDRGVFVARLETGIRQIAALRFYQRTGFTEIQPFGSYRPDPLSSFYEKTLSPNIAAGLRPAQKSFYAAAFSSKLNPGVAGYSELAKGMEDLVVLQAGFMGLNSTRNSNGVGFTTSFWENLEAMQSWASNPQHAEAQQLGKSRYYKWYKTHTARIARSSGFAT